MGRLVTLAGLLCATAAGGADPPTREQLLEWVRDLESPNFRARDQAARNLRKAGADAAPTLGRAVKSASAEVSATALRLLGEMADGSDTHAESAARRQLRRLADGEGSTAADAWAILARKENRFRLQLLFAGASYREERGKVTFINLDDVTDLASVLPILKDFPELEVLSISNRRFTDGHAKHLADLRNLRDLNLYRSNIGDEGLVHLAKIRYLSWLPIGETRITDNGLKVLGGMTRLQYLGLRGNNVTDAGLAHLRKLTDLTGLHLGETKVTDAGLRRLAGMTRLRALYLHDTAVTDAGLDRLKDFKDLRLLDLKKTKTTAAGRARLKEALPELQLSHSE